MRIKRLYNGLDLNTFTFTTPRLRPPRILGVGRLVEKKGFDDLISACAVLAERNIKFECRIVGVGEQETALREQIDGLGLHQQVKLVGPLPQHDVMHEITQAAAFAAPCVIGKDNNRDGLPTVLLEAMALGTPCVSTDVTGIPELLVDEISGLQVPQQAPSLLADALQRLLGDTALRQRLARGARHRIEQNFDIHRNVEVLQDFFDRSMQQTTSKEELIA